MTDVAQHRLADGGLLDAMLTGSIPAVLRGRVRHCDGTFPVDLEIEDGYPSDAAIEEIGMISVADSWRWFRDVFPELLKTLPYAEVECKSIDRYADDFLEIQVSTGGWSGVESVINAVLDHPILRLALYSEERGGHYVFRVRMGDGGGS